MMTSGTELELLEAEFPNLAGEQCPLPRLWIAPTREAHRKIDRKAKKLLVNVSSSCLPPGSGAILTILHRACKYVSDVSDVLHF